MGYSNNKWRKILTILMIINLCFILFAKFSRVFADTNNIISFYYNGVTYSNSIPNSFNSRTGLDYVVIRTNSDASVFYILVSQSPITFTSNNNYTTLRTSNISTDNWVYSFSPMLSANFNNYDFSNYQGSSSYTSNISFQSKDLNNYPFIYSNYDVYVNNEIVFNNNSVIYPQFDNYTEIENGNPDGVFISPGDFSNTQNLYFHLLEINTGLSNSDTSIYYYSDKTFKLNKDSDYFSTWYDPSIEGFYYYIPRYKLGLTQDTSYLYVLNNSKDQIQNSYGLYAIDTSNGIYDVVQSDTAGVITATEEETDRMKNIEQSIINNQETTNNINDSLTNTTINEETNTNIDTSMDFNNSAPNFSNMYGSYFSQLSSAIANLGSYDLSNVETINLPIPFSQESIPLTSNMVSQHMPQILSSIFTATWLFIFGKYFLAYILYIYRLIASGHILDNISTDNEVITNDVL